MKRGREIYVGPIKALEHKEGTEELKQLTYQLCDLLYKKCFAYLSVKAAKRLMVKMADICQKVKQLQVPDKAKAKKEEILDQAREKYRQLNDYTLTYKEEEQDLHQSQMVINYTVKEVVANKQKGLFLPSDLEKIKETLEDYSPMKGLRLKIIRELGEEIKEEIMKEFTF